MVRDYCEREVIYKICRLNEIELSEKVTKEKLKEALETRINQEC